MKVLMWTRMVGSAKASPQAWPKGQVSTPPGQAGPGLLRFSSAEYYVDTPRPDPAQFTGKAHPISGRHLLEDHYGKFPNVIRGLA